MTTVPSSVNFIWHMHQPCYKIPGKKYLLLPWVRLHGVKDYYGMAHMIEKYDSIKVTFNFSGILLEQLRMYVEDNIQDYYGIVTLKDPPSLTRKERDFIINRFFSVNFDNYIRGNKRYVQLYQKRSLGKRNFSAQDILDLQVIFNLCWFHPYSVKADKHLQELIAKSRDYTRRDKEYVMAAQYKILRKIFPLYKKLLQANKIEISLSPYAHPIMPLIFDTDILDHFPYLKKPSLRFSCAQDCYWHLSKAKEVFASLFPGRLRGSWPSEGGISEDIIKVYSEEKFQWIGADESILFKSLSTEFVPTDVIRQQRHLLYRLYSFNGIDVFFRDKNLSDAISFVYQGWDDAKFAAYDFIEHCKRVHHSAKETVKKNVITIIMDGENAWEYYRNNGVDFLENIYRELDSNTLFTTALPSELVHHAARKKLDRFMPGSWINGDFGVWIGSQENNKNWKILRRLRNLVSQINNPKRKEKALECLHLIQGSDWNWWNTFYDEHGDFKKIFFTYVKEIYKLSGNKIPAEYN